MKTMTKYDVLNIFHNILSHNNFYTPQSAATMTKEVVEILKEIEVKNDELDFSEIDF